MKIRVKKDQMDEIAKLCEFIDENNKKEMKIFDQLAKKLGLETEDEKNILWDCVYNKSTWMVKLIDD